MYHFLEHVYERLFRTKGLLGFVSEKMFRTRLAHAPNMEPKGLNIQNLTQAVDDQS